MDDLISRKDIKWHDYLVADGNGMYHNEKVAYKSQIDDLPSVQPEAKPPEWVAEDGYAKNRFAMFPHCPRCNADVTTGQCYCMTCGQHIDWSEDDG